MIKGFVISILLCSVSLLATAQNHTPSKINLQASSIKLEDVLEYLSHRYQLKFSYAADILNVHRADFNIQDRPAASSLQQIFDSYNLEYYLMEDNNILLRRKNSSIEAVERKIECRGVVLSNDGGTPIEFATVSILAANLVTHTDHLGHFILNVPEGYLDVSVVIGMIGYESVEVPLYKLMLDSTVPIKLKSQPYNLKQITVLGDQVNRTFRLVPHRDNISAVSIQTSRVTLVESDVLRTIQFLPGISAHNESSGEIEIRNSQKDETRITIDQLPIYNSSHFYGIFSSIHPDYVRSIDVYKNIYPISQGGKTGGIVQMTGMNQIPEEVNGTVELNLLQTSAVIDVPVNKNNAFSIAGRSTLGNFSNTNYNNISSNELESFASFNSDNRSTNRQRLIRSSPDFSFYDVQAKWKLFLPKNHHLEFNFFRSKDEYINSYDVNYNQRTRNGIVSLTEAYTNTEDWSNNGYGINWNWQINPSIEITTSAYQVKYNNNFVLNTALDQSEIPGGVQEAFFTNQSNEIQEKSIDIQASKSLKGGDKWTLGSSFKKYDVFFNVDRNQERILGVENTASEFIAYSEYVWTMTDRLKATLGLRANYYSLIDQFRFSPRILLEYNLNEDLRLKSAYSRYYQNIREVYYENDTGQNLEYWALSDGIDISAIRSDNWMAGFSWSKSSLKVDVELFYKTGIGMIEYAQSTSTSGPGGPIGSILNSGPPPTQNVTLYDGTSLSYGLDVGFAFEWSKLSSQISYTWSKSTQSFIQIDRNTPFASPNDRRHQIKIQQILNVSPFNFSFNTVFASGKPYTDYSQISMNNRDGRNARREELSAQERQNQLPDYLRLDLGAYYTYKLKKRSVQMGLTIINALDRKNVKYIQNVYSTSGNNATMQPVNSVIGTETPLLSRTLNGHIKLFF